MRVIQRLKNLRKSWDSYQPLIEVFMYRKHILHNLRQFQAAFPRLPFAPVLKSNAYGHGLVEVAKILDGEKVPFFMVDSLFEAKALRGAGITTPILVLGYTAIENINTQKLKNVAFAIISLEQLEMIDKKLDRKVNFHLKIDTGMHRQGIMPGEISNAIRIISRNPFIKLDGVCSHLADADGEDVKFSEQQIGLWNSLVSEVSDALGEIPYLHLTNTAGSDLAARARVTVGRLGLGLYGYSLSPRTALPLKPALEMKSILSSVRVVPRGEAVGYNLTHRVARDTTVATVPVGYTEGLDRRMSNKAALIVGGRACPILGRVSMNMCSIDVSRVPSAHVGQEVVVMSSSPRDPNCPARLAELCDTIVYEILVKIPPSLRRTVR